MRYWLQLLAQFALLALAYAFLVKPLIDLADKAAGTDLLGAVVIFALGFAAGCWWGHRPSGVSPPSNHSE